MAGSTWRVMGSRRADSNTCCRQRQPGQWTPAILGAAVTTVPKTTMRFAHHRRLLQKDVHCSAFDGACDPVVTRRC